MNSYLSSVKQTLTSQEITAIHQLKEQQQQKQGIEYKLDLAFFSVTDGRARHLLYWEGEQLKGYMAVFCFDPSGNEIEVTTIIKPVAKIFEQMNHALLEFLHAQKARNILYITDSKDAFIKKCMAKLGAVYTFSEYSMSLNIKNFRPMESNIQLEMALPNEAADIAGIEENEPSEEATPLDIHDLKKTKVYRESGQIIACIRIEESDNKYGIYGFVVRESHRGQGLGRKILTQVIQEIIKKQPREIYLEVETDNQPALHLYHSLGFIETCQLEYYDFILTNM